MRELAKKTLLPVVHVTSREQTLAQITLVRDSGADGAWLINHQMSGADLWIIFCAVRSEHPTFWLGLNFLGWTPRQALLRASKNVDGIWTDSAGISENGASAEAERLWALKQERGWDGLYFGGVAFKYQDPVRDLESVTRMASPWMDVVTTSGTATGKAPSSVKTQTMRRVLGAFPLAVASGITPDNVRAFLPHVDHFLVATGISRSFDEFDPKLVRALADLIHASVT